MFAHLAPQAGRACSGSCVPATNRGIAARHAQNRCAPPQSPGERRVRLPLALVRGIRMPRAQSWRAGSAPLPPRSGDTQRLLSCRRWEARTWLWRAGAAPQARRRVSAGQLRRRAAGPSVARAAAGAGRPPRPSCHRVAASWHSTDPSCDRTWHTTRTPAIAAWAGAGAGRPARAAGHAVAAGRRAALRCRAWRAGRRAAPVAR